MNSVILAGGFGSRLKPLTDDVPKPMLPLANVPMLDYVISHLYASGIDDIVLTLGYRTEQVENWVSGYERLNTRCITENVPLGTAGGVRAASAMLDERFIVVSGDALENIDYEAMLTAHRKSGKLVTMAVTEVEDPRQFGLVVADEKGTVKEFTEKPENATEGGVVNCGVYILEREALKFIPQGVKYDFSRDLFPRLVQMEQLGVYMHDGFWSDIGSPRAYYEANFKALSGAFFPGPHNRYKTISRKLGQVDVSLAAYSALTVGKCRHSIVGEYAAVSSGADVCDCVIMPGVTVSGIHYGEIIGEGYSLPITAPDFMSRHDSTQIYKNFS